MNSEMKKIEYARGFYIKFLFINRFYLIDV